MLAASLCDQGSWVEVASRMVAVVFVVCASALSTRGGAPLE